MGSREKTYLTPWFIYSEHRAETSLQICSTEKALLINKPPDKLITLIGLQEPFPLFNIVWAQQ